MAPQPGGRLWPRHGPGGRSGVAWLSCPACFTGWMELLTISRSQAGLADKRGRLVSNRCIQKASRQHWHEETASSNPRAPSLLQPRAWPAALPTTTSRAVCTDPVAPANHCRMIRALGEPWETPLIGPQTFQGCGLANDGRVLTGTVSFGPSSSF